MRKLNKKGLKAVYLFIAEMNGFKKGTVEDKLNYGRHCYYTEKMPVEQINNEDDRKDFYETIWLTRIYQKLDEIFGIRARIFKQRIAKNELTTSEFEDKIVKELHWNIPIEIDMSASVLGYVGLLTNHRPFMERCNMLGEQLVDAWEIKGIPNRTQAKVIMKTIYGSNKTCHDMWKDDGISYTSEDVKAYNEALAHGEIAVGDRFSKFIINNCNPEEQMTLHVWDEKFDVECNRYRNIGEKTINYDIYDSETDLYRRIQHTDTRKVPDLEQFRRFMVTGLIHNLDSQVINKVAEAVYDKSSWALDIHDAIILHPNDAKLARDTYAKALEDIHVNRKDILTNYFRSIGIPASAMKEWEQVESVITPLEETFVCNPMVLK